LILINLSLQRREQVVKQKNKTFSFSVKFFIFIHNEWADIKDNGFLPFYSKFYHFETLLIPSPLLLLTLIFPAQEEKSMKYFFINCKFPKPFHFRNLVSSFFYSDKTIEISFSFYFSGSVKCKTAIRLYLFLSAPCGFFTGIQTGCFPALNGRTVKIR